MLADRALSTGQKALHFHKYNSPNSLAFRCRLAFFEQLLGETYPGYGSRTSRLRYLEQDARNADYQIIEVAPEEYR
ncbi:MAG: hypothetical protein N0C84_17060 [Candidatus Thiodiazotropha taylori]|uniref:Uncharacterized protein n=1 Tax=Candidatus Thiodiazotropha taylori TaxID=2792791 RepID=A0A9E4N5W1_9GAMM|nr:hypothetical protein [Candidatus Thiodiazotropha taylori]MCW4258177.1 hypothetical protein [Candidatus Thiodiazotropha taylori]